MASLNIDREPEHNGSLTAKFGHKTMICSIRYSKCHAESWESSPQKIDSSSSHSDMK
jgi:hypothetical protein